MNDTFMEAYYNLTKIFSSDVIDDPTQALGVFNSEMGGVVVTGVLAVIMVILFVYIRDAKGLKDSEAAVFASVSITFVGLLLFLASTTTGVKLLTWEQLIIFGIIAAVSIGFNYSSKSY